MLDLKQFLTYFPHEDNTFLGMIGGEASATSTTTTTTIVEQPRTLVYGKEAYEWAGGATALEVRRRWRRAGRRCVLRLQIAAKYTTIEATVENATAARAYAGDLDFVNHGLVESATFSALLRRARIFLGLSHPLEGAAAVSRRCANKRDRLQVRRRSRRSPPAPSLSSHVSSRRAAV